MKRAEENGVATPGTPAAASQDTRPKAEAPRVLRYLDYRTYLSDYYAYKKATSRSFSYRAFARSAAITSHSYIKMVMIGKKELSLQSAKRLARACDLSPDDQAYFIALVNWNQAESLEDKQVHWREVLEHRPASVRQLEESDVTLITDWRVVAILEMTRLKSFRPDPKWISSRLRNPVSPHEVEHLIERLIAAGMVRRENGRLVQVEQNLSTGHDVPNTAIQMYHHEVARHGVESLPQVDVSKREFSAATITVRIDQVPELKRAIREFQNRVLERVAPVQDGDAVYQLNIQFFPVTREEET